MTKPLISKVVVESRPQKVEYEGLDVICFSCSCIGHQKDSCPTVDAKNSGLNTGGMSESVGEDSKSSEATENLKVDKFGPWMVVPRRNSFSKKKSLCYDVKGRN